MASIDNANLVLYKPSENFSKEEILSYVNNKGFSKFYDIFSLTKDPTILDLHNTLPRIKFQKLANFINTEGTISPSGPILDTPEKIKLELKPHQKRTLYEMVSHENPEYRYTSGFNVNFLCDNVGSGKSLCILALIANKPKAHFKNHVYYSSKKNYQNNSHWYGNNYDIQYTLKPDDKALELNTNLIVVPHNIFLQWKDYINQHTTLKALFISGKKVYSDFCKSKKNIIDECNKNDIILVKSTMYKKLYNLLNEKLLDGYAPNIDGIYHNEEVKTDRASAMRLKMRTLKAQYNVCYKNFVQLLEKNSSPEEIETLKKDYIFIRDSLNNLLTNYDWNKIGQHHEKKIPEYEHRISGYYFQRVVVDEVDSITIPRFPYIYSKQIWYISSSINNIIYPYGRKIYNHSTGTYKVISSGISGTGFLKDIIVSIFRNMSYNTNIRLGVFRGLFTIVRNNNNFIQHSIHIPEPIVNFLKCFTPPHIHIIKHAIDKEALKAFNAGDHKKAIEILGCKGGTEKDLIDQITKKLKDKQKILKDKISIKTTYQELCSQKITSIKTLLENPDLDILTTSLYQNELDENKKNVKNCKLVIKNSKDQIISLTQKIKGIEERLGNVGEKQCPICYCPFEKPGVTPCCNNIFCIECITMALSTSKACPLCRKNIKIQDVNLIINTPQETNSVKAERKLLTKLENLVKILKDKPAKRFMIFSEFDESLRQIKSELEKIDIVYSNIKGASASIKNIITKFKDGEFRVLLLNAKHFGAGLNLQFTDEIIIFHRMSKDLECQVIGRAQRLGRTDPLKINYLCYDNEYL